MIQKTKVLVFANIPIQGEKNSLGGATVLTQEIIKYLNKNKLLEVKQIQIRKFWKSKFQLIDFLLWIIKFPFIIKNQDVVSLHATKDMHFYLMPILIIWLKIFKVKYTYHFFAGNFHKQYELKGSIHQEIINQTILKAKCLFFETKEMVSFFRNKTKGECIWLPNSRKPQQVINNRFKKKLVFISRILPCKGVEEILYASKKLPKDYTIDFYGPINNTYYPENYFKNTLINYCGILKPSEVIPTLNNYNIMLLPTYCYGEGYPGIIIEALSIGMPVITTDFNSISEIIKDRKNGRLVKIKDKQALLDAILEISKDNYQQYIEEAILSFKSFNSELVFKKFSKAFLDD
jgi:glycosyltransferase involved in cell wall biosynthesis